MKWIGASTELVMDHPVEWVWEFVSNIENFGRWADGVEEPRWTSEGERGVGSTYESKYAYAGKTHEVEYEVTEFRAASEVRFPHHRGAVPVSGHDID